MKDALKRLGFLYLKSGYIALLIGVGFLLGVAFTAVGLGFATGQGWLHPPA